MSVDSATAVYCDPYRADINVDPYPVHRRLRDEAPLYFNEPYGGELAGGGASGTPADEAGAENLDTIVDVSGAQVTTSAPPVP